MQDKIDPRFIRNAWDLVGDYAYDEALVEMLFSFAEPDSVKLRANRYAMSTDGDCEAKLLLALANGKLSDQLIIPTNLGFLWAAEAGLLRTPFVNMTRLGTLVPGRVDNRTPSNPVGYAVRWLGDGVTPELLDALETCRQLLNATITELMDESLSNASDILSILLAPVFECGDASCIGLLNRVSPVSIVSSSVQKEGVRIDERTFVSPGKDWMYEVEFNARPLWWKEYLHSSDIFLRQRGISRFGASNNETQEASVQVSERTDGTH